MKSKEEEHENHAKSFQMKTIQPKEIINQSLYSKQCLINKEKFSLHNLIKPLIEYIIKHE